MAIWVIKDKQREGPYEEQDVRELMYEGTYSNTDPAIRDGQFDWSTLGQVLAREPSSLEPTPSPLPPIAEPPPLLPPEEPIAHEVVFEPPVPATSPDLPTPSSPPPPLRVTVVDFQMSLGSMVIFMVKWMLACIPALLILGAIVAIFWGACIALLSALLR